MVQNLLVTGGAGFIGSCFVAQAVERGDHVIILDALTYAGHKENLTWIDGQNWSGSYELVVGNICDGSLVESLLTKHTIDALVHFAAESHVDNSIASPAAFMETNIMGTYTLLEAGHQYWNSLEASAKERFRFLLVSTDEVYGSLDETGMFTETSRYQPNSPYSASKASADMLARAWFHTYGFPTITTNCSNNYGPRQYTEKLIPVMITKALNNDPLPVYGQGANIRDWIHVEDHCRGIHLALTKGNIGEVYCFGGKEERKNLDIVNLICKILQEIAPIDRNYKDQITFVEDRPGHDFRYAIDDSKAESELGFTRQYDFNKGLTATITWYLENPNWFKA